MSCWVLVNPELGSGRSIASLNRLPRNWLVLELSSTQDNITLKCTCLAVKYAQFMYNGYLCRSVVMRSMPGFQRTMIKLKTLFMSTVKHPRQGVFWRGSAESVACFGKEWKKRISPTTVRWWLLMATNTEFSSQLMAANQDVWSVANWATYAAIARLVRHCASCREMTGEHITPNCPYKGSFAVKAKQDGVKWVSLPHNSRDRRLLVIKEITVIHKEIQFFTSLHILLRGNRHWLECQPLILPKLSIQTRLGN